MVFVVCYVLQLPIAIYAWRFMPLRHELAPPFHVYRRMAITMGVLPLAYLSLFFTSVMVAVTFIGVQRRRAVLARHATLPSVPPPPLPPTSAPAPAAPPAGVDLVTSPSVRASAVLFTGPHPRVWRTAFGVLGAATVILTTASPLTLLGAAAFWIALGALWNPGRRLDFFTDGTATLAVTGRILARRNVRTIWSGPCTPRALAAADDASWQRVAVGDTRLWISRQQRRQVLEAWTYGTA